MNVHQCKELLIDYKPRANNSSDDGTGAQQLGWHFGPSSVPHARGCGRRTCTDGWLSGGRGWVAGGGVPSAVSHQGVSLQMLVSM